MKTLKEYIWALQEAGHEITDIEAVKAEYRRKYRKLYKQNYAKSRKRKELAFSIDQYQMLETAAKEAGMKVGPFAIRLIFSALQNAPLQVQEVRLREFVSALRPGFTLLNQWVRKSNQHDNLYLDDIRQAYSLLQQIEKEVVAILKRPIELIKEVEKALLSKPAFPPN